MSYQDAIPVSTLMGRTLTNVEDIGGTEIIFTADSGERFTLFHNQDCCESVTIEDIAGSLDDLVGSPITMAEESCNVNENPEGVTPPKYQDSYTWTFYRFATAKGYVTIRWYGESNGYYSEAVTFARKP